MSWRSPRSWRRAGDAGCQKLRRFWRDSASESLLLPKRNTGISGSPLRDWRSSLVFPRIIGGKKEMKVPAPIAIRSLADIFDVPLCNLGEIDNRLQGILCPVQDIGSEKVGITAQFLGEADTYHSRYSNSEHFNRLFEQAFGAADLPMRANMSILDIGAGSGTNTIQPALTLFPQCQIVATDLSPELLRILQHYLVKNDLQDRVTCVCMDAMNSYFLPARFDMVVGAAILHHLVDPTKALQAAYRALKPGGIAVFFEPFEGLAIIRIAFEIILERAGRESSPLEPAVSRMLAAISLDYATRAGSDKSAAHFRYMDDKWLFTRDYLERESRKAGFSGLTIVPHTSTPTLFQDYVVGLLRLAAELERDSLPQWAWDVIIHFDQSFSLEMKRDLLLEGTIVLRKGMNDGRQSA